MSTGRADFQERRKARVVRLKLGAHKARQEAAERLDGAKRLQGLIPFGQPILVGHHSEGRHRRDLGRIHAGFAKGYQALEQAKTLESRAEHAEAARDISSDDPDAPNAIKLKIADLRRSVESMKEINKILRSAKDDRDKATRLLICAGYPDEFAELTKGYPSFRLTNANAEIRRLENRLKILADTAQLQSQPDEQIGDVILRERNNRTQLIFPGKPDEALRSELKKNGFKWAPSVGAWQRLSNVRAHYYAQRLARMYTPC